MGQQAYCDICRHYRQNPDGTSAVHRYGLSRQVKVPGMTRGLNDNRVLFKRHGNFGGIDICDECWRRVGQPKQRPDLWGKTGPKR